MRRTGSRSRSVSVFVLLALSSATLSTTSARAEPPAPAPAPITPLVPPPSPPPSPPLPIELREVFWGGPHGQLRHSQLPFQGNTFLEGAALYRALGREDLARAYESRGGAKVALAIAGLGAMVIGAIVLANATPETQCDTPPKYSLQPPVCQTDFKQGTVAVGMGMVFLAPALTLVSALLVHADPVSPAERQRLIDAFNASLAH